MNGIVQNGIGVVLRMEANVEVPGMHICPHNAKVLVSTVIKRILQRRIQQAQRGNQMHSNYQQPTRQSWRQHNGSMMRWSTTTLWILTMKIVDANGQGGLFH